MDNSNNNQPKLKDISNNEEKINYTKNSLLELFKEDERLANEMDKITNKKQNRTDEDIAEFERLVSLSEELGKKATILKAEWLEMMKKKGI